ncbi:hypothetical protein PHMEG_00012939 [Phytophthora megakarya]|uniref:TKL protein kinase n=1 Tax=Phytophthora megakarya TaxID=4795 RepID=A0A225W9M5_9STRA|nr:hypothetical protein PHMEG_00012939 [Phytophthora megakarya]
MKLQANVFGGILATSLLSLTHAGVVVYTSYYEGDYCSGTPQFIYEESIENCQPANCSAVTIGNVGYSRKVDCHANDRDDTSAIYSDVNAPYVLLEQYSPPTGCENFVNALAFYADGLCHVLPDIAPYTAAIAVVDASLSVELKMFNDQACTDLATNASVASTDVSGTCFVGYSDSYGLVYYTTEYAEVVLPIIYSVHQAILYNMHNRAYYPTLAEMTSAELMASIKNVLLYSSLEFVSLIIALIVLKNMLGFSTLHQLAFVLETQASMVQSKLTTLFVYVMQVPLTHLGADFSFKFAWIHG